MSDGDMPVQRPQGGLVEDLGDESHVLEDENLGAVAHCDARGFLTAVLQGVKAEERELGDLLAGSPDTEDAASVLGAFLAGKKIVVESSVTTWHAFESRPADPAFRHPVGRI
ncbi:hypothetical protein GCM10009639_51040 [Kitasatospora putterlickiae]|uniref:Uncharacterized protein n=1 Tax=Kitasatospora putterlickiae TaxID=221725 RepID=A0ABN1YCY2_9ACTN